MSGPVDLLPDVLSGHPRAIARAISLTVRTSGSAACRTWVAGLSSTALTSSAMFAVALV